MSNKVIIAGEEYEVGSLNAKKVAAISNLIGGLIIRGKLQLNDLKAAANTNLALGILAALQEEDLVKFSAILVNCEPEFARENFDLIWVTEALKIQMEETDLQAVITNFTALLTQLQQ